MSKQFKKLLKRKGIETERYLVNIDLKEKKRKCFTSSQVRDLYQVKEIPPRLLKKAKRVHQMKEYVYL